MLTPSSLRCALAALLLLTACRKEEQQPAATPAPAAVSPPVDVPAVVQPAASREDALACEALMDLRTLMSWQAEYFAEKSRYAADASALPALPACADGTRAATSDASWSAGCHFRYRVSATSPLPEATFTVQAVGSGAAAGREYGLRSGLEDAHRSWPTALTPDVCGAKLTPSVCEAAVHLRQLYVAQKALYGEKDRYAADLREVGFSPDPCLDGTRAGGLAPPGAGCHFHYAVEVQGSAPEQTFLATARGAGPMAGTTLQYSSGNRWGPAGVDVSHCFPEPAVCEAAANLRALFTAQKAYFAEKDRYSEDLALVGFAPEDCEGAIVPWSGEVAGCHYAYRVEVLGAAPEQTFVAHARGMDGTELRYDSSGSWTPAEPACGR